jgi:hypothetical protein
MESSGRDGDDAKQPAGDGVEHARLPLERSPEGRFVVRSSSHPPDEQTSAIDSSGVHNRPQSGSAPKAEQRPLPAARDTDRRSTPAERPRKRKELKQGSTYLADVRARCDTPRALPGARISDRPSRVTSAASEQALPALPALAALAGASATSTADEAPVSVDEVTRRIRRPSSPESVTQASAESQMPWRTLAAAGVIAALFVLAVWLLG